MTGTRGLLMVIYCFVMVALVLADQVFKHWISTTIAVGGMKVLVPGGVALTNLHNDGAAWSLLAGQQGFFFLITLAALGTGGYFLVKNRKRPGVAWPLVLILAGAVGNFIDRLRQGYVVDMFQLLPVNFPVFNLADVCLTVGVLTLVVVILKED